MAAHTAWHVLILATTLFVAAGAMILLLGPLIFGEPPPGLVRARPFLAGAGVLVVAALLVEWLGVH